MDDIGILPVRDTPELHQN